MVRTGPSLTAYLRDSSAQTHRDQGPQLHHLEEEEAETEAEGEGVEEVSEGADDLAGGEEPGDDAGEGDHDPHEEENPHALVTVEGPVTHLDEDVGQHPQRDADTEYGEGDDDQGPGPPDEGLVGGDDGHVRVVSGPVGGGQLLAGVHGLYRPGVDGPVLGIDR